MAGNWIKTTLGDVLTLQRGFDLPAQNRRSGTVPVVASTGIVGSHDEALVKSPGVVMGRSGSIGGAQFITNNFWPLNTTLWVKDFRGNYPRFVYYLLSNIDFKGFNVGSGVPTLNRNHIHSLPVNVPSSYAEQKAIAHILGTLDDKIELNQQMNRNLEAIAQAIFKSWFVDFDPVHAKLEGRQPTGIDAATTALFPDSFEDSSLGEIPKGWKIAPIGNYVDAVKGLSYKGSGLSDSGIPLHNLNSVYEGGGYKHEGIKYYIGEYKERHVLQPGDVIVTNTEQGFKFLLIGFPAIVPRRYGEFGLFSHHLFRVRPLPNSPLTSHFIYLLLMTEQFRSDVVGYTNGTTVNMLSADGLKYPLLAIPPQKIISTFEAIAAPLFEKIEQNYEESRTLIAIRDTLLPKLMSGEIRVKEVEEILEDVA